MMHKLIKCLVISIIFASVNVFAAGLNIFRSNKDSTPQAAAVASPAAAEEDSIPNLKNKNDYQKIIEDYRAYLININPKIRDEVKEYRIEVAKLNEEKRNLYKSLSNEAQAFLKTANEFRRRLPLQDRRKLDLEQTTNIKSEQTNQ